MKEGKNNFWKILFTERLYSGGVPIKVSRSELLKFKQDEYDKAILLENETTPVRLCSDFMSQYSTDHVFDLTNLSYNSSIRKDFVWGLGCHVNEINRPGEFIGNDDKSGKTHEDPNRLIISNHELSKKNFSLKKELLIEDYPNIYHHNYKPEPEPSMPTHHRQRTFAGPEARSYNPHPRSLGEGTLVDHESSGIAEVSDSWIPEYPLTYDPHRVAVHLDLPYISDHFLSFSNHPDEISDSSLPSYLVKPSDVYQRWNFDYTGKEVKNINMNNDQRYFKQLLRGLEIFTGCSPVIQVCDANSASGEPFLCVESWVIDTGLYPQNALTARFSNTTTYEQETIPHLCIWATDYSLFLEKKKTQIIRMLIPANYIPLTEWHKNVTETFLPREVNDIPTKPKLYPTANRIFTINYSDWWQESKVNAGHQLLGHKFFLNSDQFVYNNTVENVNNITPSTCVIIPHDLFSLNPTKLPYWKAIHEIIFSNTSTLPLPPFLWYSVTFSHVPSNDHVYSHLSSHRRLSSYLTQHNVNDFFKVYNVRGSNNTLINWNPGEFRCISFYSFVKQSLALYHLPTLHRYLSNDNIQLYYNSESNETLNSLWGVTRRFQYINPSELNGVVDDMIFSDSSRLGSGIPYNSDERGRLFARYVNSLNYIQPDLISNAVNIHYTSPADSHFITDFKKFMTTAKNFYTYVNAGKITNISHAFSVKPDTYFLLQELNKRVKHTLPIKSNGVFFGAFIPERTQFLLTYKGDSAWYSLLNRSLSIFPRDSHHVIENIDISKIVTLNWKYIADIAHTARIYKALNAFKIRLNEDINAQEQIFEFNHDTKTFKALKAGQLFKSESGVIHCSIEQL